MREDDPLPVAKAVGMATALFGAGIPGAIAVGLVLGGLALYPLVGPSAWDPFFSFVDDSSSPLLLTLLGLGTITILLFVTALIEIRGCSESRALDFGIFSRMLLPRRRGFPFRFLPVTHCRNCATDSPLYPSTTSDTLTSPLQTTLLVSVGITSNARRLH